MGLFKRTPAITDDAVRCPACHERVPEGVRQCTMCGRSLVDALSDEESARARDANGAEHA